MGRKVIWTICVLITILENASSMKLTGAQRQCYMNKKHYEDGATFNHTFEGSVCEFQCTCVVKNIKGIWAPTGTCVHRCSALDYPPHGCKPVSDGCCTVSFTCPRGEKCQDDKTGLQYVVGATWRRKSFDSMCECKCAGEGVGRYQCECAENAEMSPFPPVRHNPPITSLPPGPSAPECILDDSEPCTACPIGMMRCPIRAKCERWDYKYKGIDMECTCNGQKGTRCMSKNRGGISMMPVADLSQTNRELAGHRAKRSRLETRKGRIVEIYFSEAKRQLVEPSTTTIFENAKK